MFSSEVSNDKIEKLNKRALQIIESDFTATSKNAIAIDESITIHKQNLQFLMTEIYETLNGMKLPFMKEISARLDTAYNLKSQQRLEVDHVRHLHMDLKLFLFGEVKSGILQGIILSDYQVYIHLSKKPKDGMVRAAPEKSAHELKSGIKNLQMELLFCPTFGSSFY